MLSVKCIRSETTPRNFHLLKRCGNQNIRTYILHPHLALSRFHPAPNTKEVTIERPPRRASGNGDVYCTHIYGRSDPSCVAARNLFTLLSAFLPYTYATRPLSHRNLYPSCEIHISCMARLQDLLV